MATDTSQGASYVFLSYASADRKRALHLADLLEANGVPVWFDRKSIAGGTNWSGEIVRGVEGCTALAILCSGAATVSPNVQQEVQLAWESRKTILPLLLESVEVPSGLHYALAGRQWIEILDHPPETWLSEILRSLDGLGLQRRVAVPPPETQQKPVATPSLLLEPSPRHNLPAQLTSFVGRERELADVRARLRASRLLTLTGTGGCGKTRLALHAAESVFDEFRDGVWVVELAPLASPELIPRTIATVLSAPEQPGQSILSILTTHLRPLSILLVLDNCEHLVDGCAHLSHALLQACPMVRILATSREALGVSGEAVYWVPSLLLPPLEELMSLDKFAQFEAMRLFADRAAAVVPDFAITEKNVSGVAQLCIQLDGMPLAIELAAARTKVLTVDQIVARLDDRFGLLTTGSRAAQPRHHTLRGAIAWSYDLLSESEQVLFDRLSVFAGGWTLEAAEAVGRTSETSVLDGLARLVDRSLVVAETKGTAARYRYLETLRQYALEQLKKRGEVGDIQRRHADYFLSLAETVEPHLEGNALGTWLDLLKLDHDNLRAALGWFGRNGNAEAGLRLATALRLFWHLRGHLTEGRERIVELLALGATVTPVVHAKALDSAGFLARFQGEYAAARSLITEGLAIRRRLGDRQGIVDSLSNLAAVHLFEGDDGAAQALYEESLETNRTLGNRQGIADGLSHLGLIALDRDDFALARRLHTESLEIWQALGDGQGIGWALFKLADVALHEGRLDAARPLLVESLRIRAEIGHTWGIAESFEGIGRLAAAQGDPERALKLTGAGAALSEASGILYNHRRKAELEAWLQRVRQEFGVDAANAAWAIGREMSLDAAIDYGLAVDPPVGAASEQASQSALAHDPGALTRREQEVVVLIARGLTNREIAAQLVISQRTAERHVENILGRLGLESRTQIAVWAIEHGMIGESGPNMGMTRG